MSCRDIIVIGAGSGGLAALRELVPWLPADLPASVFVVLRRGYVRARRGEVDFVAELLGRKTQIAATEALDGKPIRKGHLYVAPPRSHLTLAEQRMSVAEPPADVRSPAAVDALFRSAALAHGARVLAVLLSGGLDDGTAGLWDVRRRGGITIVQDPAEAKDPSLPRSAMNEVPVHYCLPVAEIGRKLVQLATDASAQPPGQGPLHPRVLIVEDERIVAMNLAKRLSDLGYDVVASVAEAEQALSIVPRVSPDVVLMDIQLAGRMKGTEAARILWEELNLPILYLTAYSDAQTVEDAKPSMPYGYIVKPFRPAEIHAAIQLALDRREREIGPRHPASAG